MLQSLEDLLRTLTPVYQKDDLPRSFLLLQSAERVRSGEDVKEVAKAAGTTPKRLRGLAGSFDPMEKITGATLAQAALTEPFEKARSMLGQLLLGVLAERAFEKIYKITMGTTELKLEDFRESRNETDYRVLNGQSRPMFRINIKFHGTRFRKAAENVGLQPEDCFALATYKIYQGLQKHEKEVLPYIFAIVGVPELTGARVGQAIPEDFIHVSSLTHVSKLISGKRDIEDRIVLHLLDTPQPAEVQASIDEFRRQIEEASWSVISARRANLLLREKLFDRVFALRVRAFARTYRNAELDMHFSLKEDLTPLEKFLELLKSSGPQGLSVHLERGLV